MAILSQFTEPPDQSAGPARRHFPVPGSVLLIFTLCIFTTLVIWDGMVKQEERHLQSRFNEHVERSRVAVSKTLREYEECLLAARAMLAASKTVDSREFQTYVRQLDIQRFLPGMIGLAIIHRVPDDQLAEFVSRNRRELNPEFEVTPPGHREEYWILTYLEPRETVSLLMGFDTRTDPVRRAALEQSRDSNSPTLTRKVRLPLPEENVDAVVLALPVFSRGDPSTTVRQRRENCVGWVTLAIRLERFLSGVPAFAERHLQCRLIDAQLGDDESILIEKGGLRSKTDENRLISRRRLELAGRSWILEVCALPEFTDAEGDRDAPWHTFVGGVLFSILVSIIVWSLSTTRERAISLARNMTVALQASEAESRKLALIASRTSNSVVLTDAQGHIEWANEGFTRITEYSLEEVVGKKPGHLLQGPHTDAATVRLMRSRLAVGAGFKVEVINYSKSGREYWIETEVQPILDESGRLMNFMAIQSDITDRKNAEQALRESERRYRTLISNIPEAVYRCAFDSKWSMEYVSDSIQDLCGHPASEFLGNAVRSYASIIHPDDRARAETTVRDAVMRHEPFFLEYRVIHRDGTVRWASEKGQAAYDENGDVLWLDGAIGNATLRKRAETELREYNAALVKAYKALAEANRLTEAATRAKSEFLANMSHEIRTPMTAILGYTDILIDEGRFEPELLKTLVTIKRNGEHLLEIINDILDISKIEAGKLQIEQVSFSPIQILSEVQTLMKVRAEAKKLPIVVACEGPLPNSIESDPTRLRQILINLVGNAIKFTAEGSVSMIARMIEPDAPRPCIQIDVIDTGIGLEQGQIQGLFQAFTQADSSMTRKYGGTGLGLAVSRRLAQMLGGDISVRSIPGKGSTFSLIVAAGRTRTEDRGVNPSAMVSGDTDTMKVEPNLVPTAIERDRPLAGRRILIVEDGQDNQRLITYILEHSGAEVALAENGQRAISMVKAMMDSARPGAADVLFDLILMDMQMPEIDGYDATRILREIGYHRPIIALTAHAMTGDREKCLAAGCDDYAAKPIDRRDLIDRLVRCLSSPAKTHHDPAGLLSSIHQQVQDLTKMCEISSAPPLHSDVAARGE